MGAEQDSSGSDEGAGDALGLGYGSDDGSGRSSDIDGNNIAAPSADKAVAIGGSGKEKTTKAGSVVPQEGDSSFDAQVLRAAVQGAVAVDEQPGRALIPQAPSGLRVVGADTNEAAALDALAVSQVDERLGTASSAAESSIAARDERETDTHPPVIVDGDATDQSKHNLIVFLMYKAIVCAWMVAGGSCCIDVDCLLAGH